MLVTTAPTAPDATPPGPSPGALSRLVRAGVALVASVLAVSCAVILLGAYVPAVPRPG